MGSPSDWNGLNPNEYMYIYYTSAAQSPKSYIQPEILL